MSIIYQIPLQMSFELPTGIYRGKLVNVLHKTKVQNGQIVPMLRFLFEVQVPSMKGKIPMAGRNFYIDLNPAGLLRRYLETWLGTEFFLGKETINFESLIGMEGELHLQHFTSTEHPRVFVNIESIHPVGTLQLTEEPAVQPPESPVEEVKEAA